MEKKLQMLPMKKELKTKRILVQLFKTKTVLEELKFFAQNFSNQDILINAIMLNEAKNSSEIGNIITTHEAIYRTVVKENYATPEAQKVVNYREAMIEGYNLLKEKQKIDIDLIIKVQQKLGYKKSGVRTKIGARIKNPITDEEIYKPPQKTTRIMKYMENLEEYINNEDDKLDPLIKLAIIHYQFVLIYPFFVGNERTGRIIDILYLISKGLLDTPILHLSKYIHKHRERYYKLLQETIQTNNFEPWIIFILLAIEKTAQKSVRTINMIKTQMEKTRYELIDNTRMYSNELLEILFRECHTKIPYVKEVMEVQKRTTQKNLDRLVELGLFKSEKIGRERVYRNERLFKIMQDTE